jgi:hypothetical protein
MTPPPSYTLAMPHAEMFGRNDRRLPWTIRHRYPRNRILRSLSWIWSNPITMAIPSQIANRRQDLRRLVDRLKPPI